MFPCSNFREIPRSSIFVLLAKHTIFLINDPGLYFSRIQAPVSISQESSLRSVFLNNPAPGLFFKTPVPISQKSPSQVSISQEYPWPLFLNNPHSGLYFSRIPLPGLHFSRIQPLVSISQESTPPPPRLFLFSISEESFVSSSRNPLVSCFSIVFYLSSKRRSDLSFYIFIFLRGHRNASPQGCTVVMSQRFHSGTTADFTADCDVPLCSPIALPLAKHKIYSHKKTRRNAHVHHMSFLLL